MIGQVRVNYDIDIGGRSLAGNFTPGAWGHTGEFDDRRFTAQRVSIADPGGTGIAAKLRGNFGIFAVVEQTLYRPPAVSEKGVSASLPGVTAFGRIAYSPPDRNLIDLARPSGGIPNPNDPSRLSRIGDAAVFGLTSTLRY